MRVDLFLSEKGYFDSRNKAKEAINRGEVYINGKLITKVSLDLNENLEVKVEIKAKKSFVSLGGYKIDKALLDFSLDVNGFTAVDVGASTGGFTDCLLQNGAKKVFSVDLNDTLLHEKLKKDDRVVPIIKNAKFLEKSDFSCIDIDLITADLSFISETIVMPIFASLLESGKKLLVLIKPQFETDGKIKFKNGIIRDKKYQFSAIEKVYKAGLDNQLIPYKITTAPKNYDKNLEFLMLFIKDGKELLNLDNFKY